MPGRRRRRGSSASTVSRASRGAIHHSTSTRARADSASLRRSQRLSRLLVAREDAEPGPSEPGPADQDSYFSRDAVQALTETVGPWTNSTTPSHPRRTLEDLIAAQESVPLTDPSSPPQRRVRTSPRHTRPQFDQRSEGTRSPYSMNVLIEPPEQVRPGHILDPPIVVRLDQTIDQHLTGRPPEDYSLLWALLSVVTEDGSTMLAPPRTDLLTGTRVDSVHALTPVQEDREIGFMSFPDLAIREAGRYRIRISLVRMNPVGGANSNTNPGGVNVQNTSSRVIHVDHNAEPSQLGELASTSTLVSNS